MRTSDTEEDTNKQRTDCKDYGAETIIGRLRWVGHAAKVDESRMQRKPSTTTELEVDLRRNG